LSTNNRSLTFRIPAGDPDSRRVEHLITGADANPYLVLASALAGMHHGLTNQLDPGPTTEGNAGEYVDPTIPFNFRDSLERLEDAPLL
jgi:glutamine synthetase